MAERVLWSNHSLAVIIFNDGYISVYRIYERFYINEINKPAVNREEIADAERAIKLGIDKELGKTIIVPERLFEERPILKREKVVEAVQAVSLEKTFDLTIRNWRYPAKPFFSNGIRVNRYEERELEINADISPSVCLHVQNIVYKADHHSWEQAKGTLNLRDIPVDVYQEAERLFQAYAAKGISENNEYNQKRDAADRERLNKKFGVK